VIGAARERNPCRRANLAFALLFSGTGRTPNRAKAATQKVQFLPGVPLAFPITQRKLSAADPLGKAQYTWVAGADKSIGIEKPL
jgi:hypothetical protein